MNRGEADKQVFPEDRNMEFLKLDKKVYIPTCDQDGKTSWGELTAVTRHDPSEKLYEFTTLGGRKVTVADSESMLIWNDKTNIFEKKHSKDIKLDEYVPVTASLPEPPIINTYVDMSEYFPKTEYIYGTDCFKAVEEIKLAKIGRKNLPNKWWEKNNGKLFTVPYKRSGFLEVAMGRENHIIKEGYVYVNGHRTENGCLIPDKFDLDYENGIFMGLYLAEGSTRNPQQVAVSNTDRKIKDFVIQWFNKFQIHNLEENYEKIDEITQKKKISESIVGNSTLMASFLDTVAGHGAINKMVPSFAYNAPEDFVLGLLNGYFSGDGNVEETRIRASSISSKLIEGIAMLCARIGAFGNISVNNRPDKDGKKINPEYVLRISGQWANIFNKKVEFILDYKNDKLSGINNTQLHRNYPHHNNIVLDRIIDIKIISDHKETKLYDVTVPSTLNFSAANGLQLVDTSETGYIQRKLVKAMEDCKINYDFTVRNASGSIIQFLYGEDGMDAAKIESQPILYIEKDFDKLKSEYLLTKEDKLDYFLDKDTIKAFKANKDWEKKFKEHFEIILSDREYIITKIFENKKETSILYPISLMRLINNSKAIFKDKGLSDLNPMFILDTIEGLTDELYVSKTNRGNMILKMLLRCYLSPKKVIFDYKFSKSTFDYIIQQIKLKFYDAIAHPSEMVGVIAAQSIGEPATQMSVMGRIIINIATRDKNTNFHGKISEFIDKQLEDHKDDVVTIGKDSVVMDMKDDYYIVGVSNEEQISWRRISQVSRHPANGGIVKVTTRSGKTTTATLSHSFLKRTEKGIAPVLGSDLKVGNHIPVAKNIPEFEDALLFKEIGEHGDVALSRDFGWLCGAYIADGHISGNTISISKIIPEYYEKVTEVVNTIFELPTNFRESERLKKFRTGKEAVYKGRDTFFNSPDLSKFFANNFGNGSHNKHLPGWIYASNKEFIAGVLGGYFDGDGNVNSQKGKQMIRNGSVSEELTSDMIVLLAYMGIFASKCVENPKVIEGLFHTIQISKKYARIFKDEIGFIVKEKAANLDEVIEFIEDAERINERDEIDKIPELGNVIAYIGKELALPGQSRTYGRWAKKDSIGRSTLIKYITIFEEENKIQENDEVEAKINILKQAAYSDVVWDEIVDLEILEDPKEYVYDFTVPGNDSFMVDTGILVHNTLNSVEWHTPMLFNINNKLQKVSIGEFIDEYINNVPKENIENHANDTTYATVKDLDIKVLSSDTKGQITWEKVEAVTKHPPINKDGTNTLLKVVTRSGREVIATKAKSFLKRVNNEIIQVNGDEIKIGDFLPISKTLPINENMILNTYDNKTLDKEYGLTFGLSIDNEELPAWVYQANTEFIKGLIESNKPTPTEIDQLISRITPSTNYTVPNIITKEFGEISVHRDKIEEYITSCKYPEDKAIFENILKEDIMYDEIIDITEFTSDYPYVYDLTVENTRNFNIFNGLCMADTFHLSGVSSASKAVRGVPRLKELLSVTRNIKAPALVIYLKDLYNKDKMKAKEILNTIQTTYFSDIVSSTKIYYETDDFNTTIEDDKFFLATYKEFVNQEMIEVNNLSPWLLRLEFDKDKLLEYDINMMDIYNALQEFYEDNISVMFSDDNASKLVFRIKIHESDDKHDDIITDLKALEKNILENLIVKGVKKINKVVMNKNEFFEYNPDTLTFEKTAEWVLETSGTNLIDILAHRNVDGARTISNDINEIYETLGIEAARQALFNEMSDVIKFADLYVNYRHLALLVDTMTNKGYMLSIDRHGINRVDIGPLAKSSFEETNDMIVKAGIFSELDKINGVSANIMLGQVPPCGTGDTDILIDEAKLASYFVQAIAQELGEVDPDEVCKNISVEYSAPTKTNAKKRTNKKQQSLKIV